MYSFQQLEQFNPITLKNKARYLAEKIGEKALPPIPSLKEEILGWIIDVQIKAASAAGVAGVTPRHLGVPSDWATVEDVGYFGGDGHLAACAQNYLNSSALPMNKLQPAHRGLTFDENSAVNKQEASNGFIHSRARNEGGSFYNQGQGFRM